MDTLENRRRWILYCDHRRTQLIEALKIIEENYGKYSSIKTWRATVDENGNLQEEDDKKPYEISNYRHDEQNRKRYERTDA